MVYHRIVNTVLWVCCLSILYITPNSQSFPPLIQRLCLWTIVNQRQYHIPGRTVGLTALIMQGCWFHSNRLLCLYRKQMGVEEWKWILENLIRWRLHLQLLFRMWLLHWCTEHTPRIWNVAVDLVTTLYQVSCGMLARSSLQVVFEEALS